MGSVECEAWSGECEVRSAKCGVLLQTVCMQLGILFNIPVQRAQLLRRIQTELKRRTCIVSHLSLALPSCGCLGRPLRTGCLGPKIAPNVFLRCLYFSICVVSTGLGTSHWPQERELCLTICLSHHCAVYFAFLLVATLGRRFSRLFYPLSTPMTALGQFSFRQVSPLGSPFVSLLVAALRRRNSYVFHVSNDIIRCPLWPQCY